MSPAQQEFVEPNDVAPCGDYGHDDQESPPMKRGASSDTDEEDNWTTESDADIARSPLTEDVDHGLGESHLVIVR
jgi:hypothetical protein